MRDRQLHQWDDSRTADERNFLENYRLARIQSLSTQDIESGWKASLCLLQKTPGLLAECLHFVVVFLSPRCHSHRCFVIRRNIEFPLPARFSTFLTSQQQALTSGVTRPSRLYTRLNEITLMNRNLMQSSNYCRFRSPQCPDDEDPAYYARLVDADGFTLYETPENGLFAKYPQYTGSHLLRPI